MEPPAKLLYQGPVWKMEDGDTPVRDLDGALRYFTEVLGFIVESRTDATAELGRDAARLHLRLDAHHDPAQAGSCAFGTDQLDALHAELTRSGGQPGPCSEQEHNGTWYRVFFARESLNSYCFVFTHPRDGKPAAPTV